MTFAFIGCKTDYYLSLHHHFIEKSNQLLIYPSSDAFLNETFIKHFRALIIDRDSHTFDHTLKLIRFFKILYSDIPIFVLLGQNTHQIETLISLGVHDCFQKTLSFQEIVTQIHNASMPTNSAIDLHIQIGNDYIFDMHTSILRYKNTVQPLTKRELPLLRFFIDNGDNYATLDDITRLVYHEDPTLKDVAIRSIIMRLRKKLKEDIIETYPRYGYRLKPLSKTMLTTQKDSHAYKV